MHTLADSLIDGREAVSFLVRLKECIEGPKRLLLEVSPHDQFSHKHFIM
jgi:hypothetical protein